MRLFGLYICTTKHKAMLDDLCSQELHAHAELNKALDNRNDEYRKQVDQMLEKEALKDKASRDLLETATKMQVVVDNQEKRIDELVAQSNRLYEEKLAIAEELTKYIRTNGELAAHLSELYTAFDELASEYQYLATTIPVLKSRPTKDITNSTRQKYEVFKAKYPRILDKSSSIQRVVEQSVDDRPVDG